MQLFSDDRPVDPFAPSRNEPALPEKQIEAAWFAPPRRPSLPPRLSPLPRAPQPLIDDPLADRWFR